MIYKASICINHKDKIKVKKGDFIMTELHVLVEQQVRRHLNVSPVEFDYLTHPSPNHLHDPFYYKGMREFVMALHAFKEEQTKNPDLLLMVDGDYDTDGICAATILTAALSVFGFQFRVYIPTMEDGYGLSPTAIDKMKQTHERDGKQIGMIITADNGIAAFSGIGYANSLKIPVLVTDHHPPKETLPAAKVIVDPYQPGDLYPFKGNSGACVAWKAMLAYAAQYEKESLPLIERLIVFAGFSNVADVMPIRNENRYMVTAAVKIIQEIRDAASYNTIANTSYMMYNVVFHGLFDLITLLQESKDVKRAAKRKEPIPLPTDEELLSWYLSPLLNAPRRVHDTCLEGLATFLTPDPTVRKKVIKRLIELNEEKTILRDKVLTALKTKEIDIPILCANTKKGISGIIAGKLTDAGHPVAIIFSHDDPNHPETIYTSVPNTDRITASARSLPGIPLNEIINQINKNYPGMLSGGGHECAAGFTINTKNYDFFCETTKEIVQKMLENAQKIIPTIPENKLIIYVSKDNLYAAYEMIEDEKIITKQEKLNPHTFASDVKTTINFLKSLKPFGKGFEADTKFQLIFDNTIYDMDWNPEFWKTFKWNLYGVEILTFDEQWAKEVKEQLHQGKQILADGKLALNTFRGKTTPQFIINKPK